MLNKLHHVTAFNKEYREIKTRNNAFTKRQLMSEYYNRYNALFKMNKEEMEAEITLQAKIRIVNSRTNDFENVEEVPPNYSESHPSEWMNAYIPAIKCIYRELERVSVVKKIETVETIDTSKVHEPFRNAMSRQTDILYKWCCMCDVGLDKGFCSHVFFCEHQSGTSPIPESVQVRSLTRTNRRRGRPATELMSGALDRENNQRRRR